MKATILATSLFTLAACGGKSAAPSTDPVEQEAPDAGPAFAGLFQDGASWNLSLTVEHDDGESEEPATPSAPEMVTCQVAQYAEVDGAKLAEITCGDAWPVDIGGDPLTGFWAMTAEGVWRLPEWPADGAAPDLASDAMLIAAKPVAGTTGTTADEENEGEGIESTTLEQKGDAWCHAYMSAMGDESWVTMCVGPDGPTEGTWGWAGGSVHEAKFTRAN